MQSYKILFSLLVAFFVATTLFAQNSPVGVWKTIDDETGKAKSHVEIYEQGGKYFGKVSKLLLKPADTICDECTGSKKDKPVVGMVIVENLAPYKDYWKGGTILDPANGSEYGCSIWFEDKNFDKLYVRGKRWTGLFRTQNWFRVGE